MSTGRDGKTYPDRPVAQADKLAAIALAHQVHCTGGLSERATAAEMAQRGVRRSAGSVHAYLSTWTCRVCRAPAPPPQPPPPSQPAPREPAPVTIEVYGGSVFGGQGRGYGWY
jgi:hypothetical protein